MSVLSDIASGKIKDVKPEADKKPAKKKVEKKEAKAKK